jgi:hypothetical protein
LALSLGLQAPVARADLGHDIELAKRAFAGQTRSDVLRLRLMERGEITPVVLPPWSLDATRGDCTTVLLLAPAPTQFVVHVHPWSGLPSTFASSAGALQLTRCGRDRISFLQLLVEMRSPRAVVHTLVAVGSQAPAALTLTLPERDAGREASPGNPGPLPEREPLDERVRRFEAASQNAGASSVESAPLPSQGYVRLAFEPGCHRLLATGRAGAPPYTLLLTENADDTPTRLAADETGDVQHELCTARARRLLVSLETSPQDAERRLSVAHFRMPSGLPGRFGPELAERLLQSLGGSAAPRKLGTLVVATLGAQGRTLLPRTLLPQTCYLAAAAVVHGAPQAISLGVRAGAFNAEATSTAGQSGPQLGFCTRQSGQVELDVEARGLGLSWLFFVFQMGPARPEAP